MLVGKGLTLVPAWSVRGPHKGWMDMSLEHIAVKTSTRKTRSEWLVIDLNWISMRRLCGQRFRNLGSDSF